MALSINAKRYDVFWVGGSTKITVEGLGDRKVKLLVEGPEGVLVEREAFIRKKNPTDPRLPENRKK
jgi:hypothetical protein